MKNELIRGYKVFRPDWSCRPDGGFKQYSCPGRFQQDGVLDVRGNGIHFCLKLSDCFSYYQFNSENKVAEVIAHGEVLRDGDQCCTKASTTEETPKEVYNNWFNKVWEKDSGASTL